MGSSSGAGPRGAASPSPPERSRQRRVLREYRPFELAQPLARLDPQLLDQRPAGVLVGLQRIGLAVRAVEGQHQLRPQTLPIGVLCDQRLQLPHHLGMTTKRQLRLDQLLERRDAQIIEPGDLALRERLVGELRQRRAAPQRQRLHERRNGALRAAAGQLAAPLGNEPLEAVRVEALGIKLQLVAVLAGHDHPSGSPPSPPASAFRSREMAI